MAKIHKEQKSFYLNAGRYVDGWKNTHKFATDGIEEKLKEIEEHQERKIQAELKAKREARENELRQYDVETFPHDLATMDDQVYVHYREGVKKNYEAIQQAKKDAAEAEEKRRAAEAEEKRILKERLTENERKAEIARKAIEKEREEKERIQKELDAKSEAERKRKEQEEAERDAKLALGDVGIMNEIVGDLNKIRTMHKGQFKSKKTAKTYDEVCELVGKIVDHIESKY